MANKNIVIKKEEKPRSTGYSPVGAEKKAWEFFQGRKAALLSSRKNVGGIDIDKKMLDMDKRYFNRDANIPANELDTDQSPIAIANAFSKIQTALAILIDRNPVITLETHLKKFAANRILMKSLAETSWKRTNSLGQFRLSVYNCAKRGWMAGRTLHRELIHKARFPMKTDNKGRIVYESRFVSKMDDIGYINMDNHNVWFDEEARPENILSIKDDMWREVWHIDEIRRKFPKKEFPNMKFVIAGGNTKEKLEEGNQLGQSQTETAKETKKGMTEIFFYEHQIKDYFIVEINGVMVVWEPLPQDHKRISLTVASWNWRSAETIYGIGVIEEMEKEEDLVDRILNMQMRQLLLSINPPGFYTGTEDFENENIKLKAGVLRRTQNPQDITFVNIKPPGPEGMAMIDFLEQKEDGHTGITKSLEGATSEGKGDTAFEVGVNREAGLKKLRLPLKSLQTALNWETMNRIDLIKQVYSEFDVEKVANKEDIFAYMEEIGKDPDFYFIENEGKAGKEEFFIKKFREVQMNIDKNDKGEFIEAENESFFKIKPQWLAWEGDAMSDISSMLVQSEETEKLDTLRMSNLLIPLFQLPPEIALKPAKQILIANNKEPRKWFPQAWLDFEKNGGKSAEQEQPAPQEGGQPAEQSGQLKADTVVPQTELENSPTAEKVLAGTKGAQNRGTFRA